MKKLLILSITACLVSFSFQADNQAQAFKFFKKDNNQEQAQNYTRVRAKHILVDTKQEALALKARIDNGESFDKLAKQHSKCPSGQKGGDLGFFGKGAMVPSFEKSAFSLPVGVVSKPIKTPFGYHLIIVTDQK